MPTVKLRWDAAHQFAGDAPHVRKRRWAESDERGRQKAIEKRRRRKAKR